jgi:hypothetical protein
MADRLIDDNGVINFIDDNGVMCFIDDLGNYTCDFLPQYTKLIRKPKHVGYVSNQSWQPAR